MRKDITPPAANMLGAGINRRTVLKGILLASGGIAMAGSLASCAPAAPGGAAAAGGRLVVGVAAGLADFDPYNHLLVNFPMMATMYSYLISYDDDYNATPDLASEWTISDDFTQVEITLRDTTFHSGAPVTAADVVAGIERAQNPEVALSQAALASIIASATAVDDQTVLVTLAAPTAEARILDWMYWFPVVEASSNNPEALKTVAAGSGPFILDKYAPGTSLKLKRNENYYGADLPLLDELEFRFFDSQNSLVSAVQGGSVQGALSLPARLVTQVQDKFTVTPGSPGALINVLRLNPLMTPFDNPAVRQGFAKAINRDRMIKEIQSGVGQAVYTGIAPNSTSFESDLLDKVSFDLEGAKKLFESSGATLSAVAAVDSVDEAARTALLILQEDLASIGFELTLESMDTATLNSKYIAGEIGCVVRANSNAFSSLTGILNDSGYRLVNNVLWKDQVPAEYTDAVTALQAAATPEDTEAASRTLNEVIVDLSWMPGMYTAENIFVFDKTVDGFTRTPADHAVFTEVSVS